MPVKLNSSGGGSVTLDVPATATATNLTVPAANGTIVVADNSGNVTYSGATTFSGNATFNAGLIPSSSFLRNRIINGDMRIDQRNAGASVTLTNTVGYVIDRYRVVAIGTSLGFSSQRSAVAPTGFVNSYLATVTSAKTPASTDQCRIDQFIEGVNVADLGWGAASAQTVTLSFWVRSSVTGIYCIQMGNGTSPTRSYVAQYTISSANVWEYKTITVPGDTTGTWNTDSSVGVGVSFALGLGSAFTGSVGWQAGERYQTANQTNWIANAGATFYLTGIQLEVGTAATPFERRPYGQELMLCYRYYVQDRAERYLSGVSTTAPIYVGFLDLPVQMRIQPIFSASSIVYNSSSTLILATTANSLRHVQVVVTANGGGNPGAAFTYGASAEL